jgi:hypothetical protein
MTTVTQSAVQFRVTRGSHSTGTACRARYQVTSALPVVAPLNFQALVILPALRNEGSAAKDLDRS